MSLQLNQNLLVKLIKKENLCFQETRKEITNFPSYKYYNKLKGHNPNRGGGIKVGILKQFFPRIYRIYCLRSMSYSKV